jgi:formamidopyrimidine-DNA glycosylase
MPELPEVETVCHGLASALIGRKFVSVRNLRENLRFPFPKDFARNLEGRAVKNITRRAKYILINLDNATTLIVHLGMSGRMVAHNCLRNQMDKHDHVIFQTDDGKEIVFNDPRRFGMMDIVNSNDVAAHKLIKDLGIEPLDDAFNGEYLYSLLKNRKIPVKLAVMNANLVVGVGNIYACESLFRAGILPTCPSNEITITACRKLAGDIKIILLDAIKSGGSTLKDYVSSSGQAGYFQHNFKVYGRENQPCGVCQSAIKRIVQGGRSSFYCSACQH